ncbi:MAG: cob(I)yrinic acid a,c-diamide adenosyltransferase [Ignavibacteriales bacterium]|nr:cob(I)yrinic acid a,c-diamide adenosyltransferase [Ignavibacteriales bacterium]
MKIYTKTGDKGETSLFGGKRLPKDSLRIETYGTIDELNSLIGLSRSLNEHQEIELLLCDLQSELFVLGAELATPTGVKNSSIKFLSTDNIIRFEKLIDDIEVRLPPLKNFILPGGNKCAAMLHYARTVCRRAERLLVRLTRDESVRDFPVIYLNRLSDFLFVIARLSNSLSNTPETKWSAE